MSVKLKKEGKFEFLYIKDAVVYYASVQEPKDKYQSKEREYSVTAFVSDEDREALESFGINKEIYKVGKDKNKKKKIKFPTDKFELVDGLNGLTITKDEISKQGKKTFVNVVDTKGQPLEDLIGNGSKCHIKCFGYRNQDEMLVVKLDTLMVVDLVPYEGASSFDEEFGVEIKSNKKEQEVVETEEDKPKREKPKVDDFDDEDNPFDDDDVPF